MAIATESTSLLTAKEFRGRIAPEGQIISHKATYTSIVLLLSMTMTAMAMTAVVFYVTFIVLRDDDQDPLRGDHHKLAILDEAEHFHERTGPFVLMPLGVGSFLSLTLWCLIYQTFKRGVHPPSTIASLVMILVISLILVVWSTSLTVDAGRIGNSLIGIGTQYYNSYVAQLEGYKYFMDRPEFITTMSGYAKMFKCCGLYQADDYWTGRTLRSMGGQNRAFTLDWPKPSNISNSSIELVPVFCCKNQSDPLCNIVDVENVTQPDIWKCGCGRAALQLHSKILLFICLASTSLCLLSIAGIVYTCKEVKKKKKRTA